MLMWSWNEHVRAAASLGKKETGQVVVLFDEIESHLHPRWQRSILRSVLKIARSLHERATVQLIAATHSPLVLASAEPFFDPEQDAWFDLDLERSKGGAKVSLQQREFERRGDVSSWLRSNAFDLLEARSLESEQAIKEALALVKVASPSKVDMDRVDGLLRASLGDTDRFWLRWSQFRKSHSPTSKGRK